MARPRVTEERAEQALDAFERCVARYGVEGSTLERIANEAGLSRALMRHHAGNRDELMARLLDRFIEDSRANNAWLLESAEDQQASETLLAHIFSSDDASHLHTQVASALYIAAHDNAELATKLRRWIKDYQRVIVTLLEREFPTAAAPAREAVAAGLLNIQFNVSTLYPLGRMQALIEQSREAAELLLTQLRSN